MPCIRMIYNKVAQWFLWSATFEKNSAIGEMRHRFRLWTLFSLIIATTLNCRHLHLPFIGNRSSISKITKWQIANANQRLVCLQSSCLFYHTTLPFYLLIGLFIHVFIYSIFVSKDIYRVLVLVTDNRGKREWNLRSSDLKVYKVLHLLKFVKRAMVTQRRERSVIAGGALHTFLEYR